MKNLQNLNCENNDLQIIPAVFHEMVNLNCFIIEWFKFCKPPILNYKGKNVEIMDNLKSISGIVSSSHTKDIHF